MCKSYSRECSNTMLNNCSAAISYTWFMPQLVIAAPSPEWILLFYVLNLTSTKLPVWSKNRPTDKL